MTAEESENVYKECSWINWGILKSHNILSHFRGESGFKEKQYEKIPIGKPHQVLDSPLITIISSKKHSLRISIWKANSLVSPVYLKCLPSSSVSIASNKIRHGFIIVASFILLESNDYPSSTYLGVGLWGRGQWKIVRPVHFFMRSFFFWHAIWCLTIFLKVKGSTTFPNFTVL